MKVYFHYTKLNVHKYRTYRHLNKTNYNITRTSKYESGAEHNSCQVNNPSLNEDREVC